MALRLTPITNATDAIRALESHAQEYENRSSQGTTATARRDVYLQWTDGALTGLAQHFGLVAADKLIRTRFYWSAVEIDVTDRRAAGRLEQGIRAEALYLREAAKELTAVKQVLAGAEDWDIAVLDTNVLTIIAPPWHVNWPAILGVANVRVVIPLRVIEELDRRKYDTNDKAITRTARNLLPALERRLSDGNGTRHKINDHASLEVPVLPAPRFRPAHADDEILRLCEDIRQFAGVSPTLMTDDMPVRTQAAARSIATLGVPAKYRRRPAPKEDGDWDRPLQPDISAE